MMHGMQGMGWGFMGFGWVFQIIILVLFFLVVWWMIRSNSGFGYKSSGGESASDILKRRLASGEIDDKEYHRLKKEIEK